MTSNGIKVRKMILSAQIDKQGFAGVYIEQLSYNKDLKKITKRIPTGIKVNPQHWSKVKQEVLKSDSDFAEKNKIINDAYLANLTPLSIDKVVKGIIEYFDDYIAIRKAEGTPYSTYKEFVSCRNRISTFEISTRKKLYFSDMNHKFSTDFNIFMLNELKEDGTKKYSSGTIEKTFTILRTFLNHYYQRRKEENIQLNDSFRDKGWKKGEKSINDAHPVTDNDYQKLLNAVNLSEKLTKTLDRFLFQISTGLRYSDAFTVTPAMIVNNCIKINPTKTKHKRNNTIYINLNYLSKSIIEKYNGTTALKISNQKYNDSIEELCLALELSDKYTSHDARDTFITNCIKAGVSIPIILSWTGQESYEVMKRYFIIDEQQKALDMLKLKEYKQIQ